MDIVNAKIGQIIAKDSASVINDKTFIASALVGFASGASQFTKSDNVHVTQQTRNAEKTLVKLPDKQAGDNESKRKVISENADKDHREENVNFSQSLSNVSGLLQINGTKISFSIENIAERPVVTVTDLSTGNIIRQIPSEEVQKFAERIREIESGSISKTGLVLDKQA
ncbi:MAG: flagellar protein FlaG [Alphaproteobacteria bacterium]|jgi:flagellar protein FlaG